MSLFDFFKKGETPEKPASETVENVPQMLHVKLLFEQPVRPDNEQVAAELAREFARFDQGDNDGQALLYFFPDYSVSYQDVSVPAQGSILLPEQPAFEPDSVATALTQSWHWPEAAAVIGACRYEFLLTDLMSRGLEYPRRVEYFQKFLAAVIRATEPQALYFGHSDKLVDPAAYLQAVTVQDPLNALVNVRFFNVANSTSEEMFLDTLGLHALGLPDFQIRFVDMDPNAVVGALWSYLYYIYQHGAVIEPGNTIQGLSAEDKWTCYYADAAVEPKRIVLDIETS